MVALAPISRPSREEQLDRLAGLPTLQSRITHAERWFTNSRWGDLDAPHLANVMERARRGDVQDWADLVEWIVTTDPDIFSLYVTRITRVAQADYAIVPNKYGKATLAQSAADFVDECYGRMRAVQNMRCELLHAVALGYSVDEESWCRDGNTKTNYIERFHHVHSHRMRYDMQWQLRLYDHGNKPGPQDALGYGQMLDPRTMVVHRHQEVAGYPGIGGVMFACAWPWMFGRWVEKFRLHYLEKYGSPFIKGTVPAGTDQKVRDKFLLMLERMTAEHAAVSEAGSLIEVIANGASTNSDESYDRFLQGGRVSFAKAWLGVSDATEPGANGSNAAVDTRVSAAMDPRMISDGNRLCETEGDCIARRLILQNAHKFDAPIGTVPIPTIMLKTADDEAKVDQGDKSKEQKATGDRPYEVQGESASAANDNAPVVHEIDLGVSEPKVVADDVQKQALNGAQLTSLADVVVRAANGELPRASAIKLILIAIPTLTRQDAEEALGDIGQGFVPTPAAAPPSPFAPAAPKPEAPPAEHPIKLAPPEPAIKLLSLDGDQITALADVASRVARGELPRATAVHMLSMTGTPADQVDAALGDIGQGFEPTRAPEPVLMAQPPFAPVRQEPIQLQLTLKNSSPGRTRVVRGADGSLVLEPMEDDA